MERSILAPLRNHTFFSLAEPKRAIRRLLDELNDRPFQKLDGTRRSLFGSLERPLLNPLPARPYEFAEWRKGRANIDYHVAVEHLDLRSPRGLDRFYVLRLAARRLDPPPRVALITGATGTGKTFLAWALAHAACRQGLSSRYFRLSRLLDDLALVRADGSYPRLMNRLQKTRLLVLDDFGLASPRRGPTPRPPRGPRRPSGHPRQQPATPRTLARGHRRRHLGRRILDRLVHHAHRLALKGGSMRRNKRPNPSPEPSPA